MAQSRVETQTILDLPFEGETIMGNNPTRNPDDPNRTTNQDPPSKQAPGYDDKPPGQRRDADTDVERGDNPRGTPPADNE